MSAASLVVKRLLEKKPKTRQDIQLIKLEVAREEKFDAIFLLVSKGLNKSLVASFTPIILSNFVMFDSKEIGEFFGSSVICAFIRQIKKNNLIKTPG